MTFDGTRFDASVLHPGASTAAGIWTGGAEDGPVGYQLIVSEEEPHTLTIGISKSS